MGPRLLYVSLITFMVFVEPELARFTALAASLLGLQAVIVTINTSCSSTRWMFPRDPFFFKRGLRRVLNSRQETRDSAIPALLPTEDYYMLVLCCRSLMSGLWLMTTDLDCNQTYFYNLMSSLLFPFY